ncbi:MAG TPA: hypothetical protein VNC61_02870 [Acidimicrobiales bacterium]|nr:hypothetical protein [Acidimicrobiales bacterium]
MATMRFNHMELLFPRGTLTAQCRDDVDTFYCGVLGSDSLDPTWSGSRVTCCVLTTDSSFCWPRGTSRWRRRATTIRDS